jgi:hypothetical protein
MSAQNYREGKVISMLENETVENEVPETEKECDCVACRAWKDQENLVTGSFTMPKDVYEAAVEAFPRYAGDFNQLKGQPMSAFFGMMIGKGIVRTSEEHVMGEIGKRISEKFPDMLEAILK